MWYTKGLIEAYGEKNFHTVLVTQSIVFAIFVFMGIALMLYTQDTLRKKYDALERAKIRADESNKAKSMFLLTCPTISALR